MRKSKIKTMFRLVRDTKPTTATLQNVEGTKAVIRLGLSPTLIRNVDVLGDPDSLVIGEEVSIKWEDRPGSFGSSPVVLSTGGGGSSASGTTTVGVLVDNATIERSSLGLRVKRIGLQHLSFVPSLEGHTHLDSLERAGWQIDNLGTIYKGTTYIHATGQISLGAGNDVVKLDSLGDYRVWAGHHDPLQAPFSVSKAGYLKAILGTIGGWVLGEHTLTASNGAVGMNSNPDVTWRFWAGNADPALAPFRVNENGEVWLESATINANLQSANYVSGLRGWRLNQAGDLEAQNAIIRGEIRASVLSYSEITTTAGTFGVFKSAAKLELPLDTTLVPPLTMTVKGNYFAQDDFLRIRNLMQDNWFRVEGAGVDIGDGLYEYSVTKRSGSGTTFDAGTSVIDYGPTGAGFITLSADGAVGAPPNLTMATMDVVLSPWSVTFNPLLRIGDLDGYGTLTGKGWAVGDPSGSDYAYYTPTNGMVIRGNITANSGLVGGWTINAAYIAKDTGTNSTSSGMAPVDYPFYAGRTYANRAAAPFRVTTAGALVASDATITGTITANSGSIGGWTINAAYLAKDTGTNSTSSGMAPMDYPFYAGRTYANRAAAPFRVTSAGAVTASDVTISAGSLQLNSNGIDMTASAATPNHIRWKTAGGVVLGTITAWNPGLWGYGTELYMTADHGTNSMIAIEATRSGYGAAFQVFHNYAKIGKSFTSSNNPYEPYLQCDYGITVAGGASPGIGNIVASGTIRANTAFNRSGTAGYIYVPLLAPIDATDTGSFVWSGAGNRAVATYTIDVDSAANGLPAATRAVAIRYSGNWASYNGGYYATFRAYGQTAVAGVLRANTAGYNIDGFCIVPVDTTGKRFYIQVIGAQLNAAACVIVGYYL